MPKWLAVLLEKDKKIIKKNNAMLVTSSTNQYIPDGSLYVTDSLT